MKTYTITAYFTTGSRLVTTTQNRRTAWKAWVHGWLMGGKKVTLAVG